MHNGPVPLALPLGWIGLMVGALALAVHWWMTDDHPWHHLLALLVPAVTALSYVAMMLGQGVTVLASGRVFYWARWADAIIGATLLVLNTALVALPRAIPRRNVLLVGLAAANAMAMACALFAGASVTPAVQWTWYALGAGAYSVVLWGLFRCVPVQARRERIPVQRRRVFMRLRNVLVGLSVLYPVWWIAAPLGLGWVTLETALFGFAILDVLSKAGYGVLLVGALPSGSS